MQAWCLDIPFLIFLIIVTCLDKPKILFMLDYKKIHYCTIILNLPLNKTTKKQRCMKLKSPSFQRCALLRKKDRLYLLQKVFKKAFFINLPGESWVDLLAGFFQRTDLVREDNFLNCISYQPVLCMHLKECWTWLSTSNYIFCMKRTLFDFWVSGHALSVGKLRKRVEDKCFCVN